MHEPCAGQGAGVTADAALHSRSSESFHECISKDWSNGVLEHWSTGKKNRAETEFSRIVHKQEPNTFFSSSARPLLFHYSKFRTPFPVVPVLHHSVSPVLHYSNTPLLHFPYFISLGCPVQEATVLQNLPLGSIFFRLETAMRIGHVSELPFPISRRACSFDLSSPHEPHDGPRADKTPNHGDSRASSGWCSSGRCT